MYIDRSTDRDAIAARHQSTALYYFGYGSLVNRNTRPAEEIAVAARLSGWHRCWEHRIGPVEGRFDSCSLSVTSLSVTDDPEAAVPPTTGNGDGRDVVGGIDGVLVPISLEDLPMLDAREAGYDRVRLELADLTFRNAHSADVITRDRAEIIMYRSNDEHRGAPSEAHPILQSYIDCVMAGYLAIYGEAGLIDFVRTTHGWEGPILDDRDAPRYLRAQPIEAGQQTWFDDLRQRYRPPH